jgi:peroxiredoxin
MTTGRKQPRTWTGKPADGAAQTAPGAAPGTFLSDFALPNLDGHMLRVSDQVGHSYILLFIDTTCGPSEDALRELARLRRKPGSTIPKVIIAAAGDGMAIRDLALRYETGPDVVCQDDHELITFYQVPATPAAYLVDEGRRTVGNLAIGKHAVISLLRGKREPEPAKNRAGDATPVGRKQRIRLTGGDWAPEVTLSAPEGYSISLTAQRGHRVLLVFWSASCPFCDDIAAPIARLPKEITPVIIGRSGETRPPGFAGILYGTQERSEVSDAFNLHATPSAVLIDPSGRLERDPVSGVSAVRALLASLPA